MTALAALALQIKKTKHIKSPSQGLDVSLFKGEVGGAGTRRKSMLGHLQEKNCNLVWLKRFIETERKKKEKAAPHFLNSENRSRFSFPRSADIDVVSPRLCLIHMHQVLHLRHTPGFSATQVKMKWSAPFSDNLKRWEGGRNFIYKQDIVERGWKGETKR